MTDNLSASNRRDFLKLGGATLAVSALGGLGFANANGESSEAKEHIHLMRHLVPGAVDSDGNWQLPDLDYDYSALEPHIDAQTMEIHHSRHHNGYVNGLKSNEEALAEAREKGDFGQVEHLSLKLSFNMGGHILHSVFWDCMGPDGGGDPEGAFADQIRRDFGSIDAMKRQFTAASASVEGSGWGVLAFVLASGRLTIVQGKNQNLLSPWGAVPLLNVDVWEHAYYLRYQNRRGDYLSAWWNTVDWKKVARRYDLLRGVTG